MVKETLQQRVARLEEENRQLRFGGFYQHEPVVTETLQHLRAGHTPTLELLPNLGVGSPTQPLVKFVVGDNLGGLMCLAPEYANKVDVIYIDPPYNTGHKTRYSYNDRNHKVKHDTHSQWLSFMNPRLRLAEQMLRDTGVIMVSVGFKEHAHLKLLMNSIFGEVNFITTLTVEGMIKNNARLISTSNEYWLVYAKNQALLKNQKIKWRAPKQSATTILNKVKQIWATHPTSAAATRELRKYYNTAPAKEMFITEPGLKLYNKIDTTGRLYRSGDLSAPRDGKYYTVINPNTNQPVKTPTRGWANSETSFQKMVENKQILWKGTNTPYFKRYLDENKDKVLNDIVAVSKNNSSRVLQQMIGRNKFTFPKDHTVIADWVEYVIPQYRKNDKTDPPVVLDFFAGSGTTGHAVAWLNSKNKTNYECVLITDDENNIPYNVTVPRLKAALTGDWVSGRTHPLPGRLETFKIVYQEQANTPSTREMNRLVKWLKETNNF